MALHLNRFEQRERADKVSNEERIRTEVRDRQKEGDHRTEGLKNALMGTKTPAGASKLPAGDSKLSAGESGKLRTNVELGQVRKEVQFREAVAAYKQVVKPHTSAEGFIHSQNGHGVVSVRNPFAKNGPEMQVQGRLAIPSTLNGTATVRTHTAPAVLQQASVYADKSAVRKKEERATAPQSQGTDAAKEGQGRSAQFVGAMAGVAGAKVGTKPEDPSGRRKLETDEGKKPDSKRGAHTAGRASVYRGSEDLGQLSSGFGSASDTDSQDLIPWNTGLENPNLPTSIYEHAVGLSLVNGTENEALFHETVWRYEHFVEKRLKPYAKLLDEIDNGELAKIFPDPVSLRVVLNAASRGGEALRKTVLEESNTRSNVYGWMHA